MLTEYEKAPQVTRDRMYIDTMQQIYTNITKVLVDSKQGSNLLYLPLDKIMQMSGPDATPTPATAPARAWRHRAAAVLGHPGRAQRRRRPRA